MTVNVLALTRYDRLGASSRVRFLQYVPHLERRGLKISVQPLLPRDYLTRLYAGGSRSPATLAAAFINRLWALMFQGDTDVIWLQREVLPYLPFGLEKVLLSNKPVIVDFDDAHHLYYKNSRSRLVQSLLQDKTKSLMRYAQTVVVGNPTLAGFAQAAGAQNVIEIPSAVDVGKFKREGFQDERFTIGWIGTPVTAQHSLPMLCGALQRVQAETGARCLLMGAGDVDLPGVETDRLPWSEAGEVEFFSQVSVGVCPLEDTEWNRGKSGYKIMQYMAAGVPSLVSPVGIATTLVTNGVTGFQCQTEEDWYERVMQLSKEGALRTKMGRSARTEAIEKYDTVVAADKIYTIFSNCMSN